MYNPRVIYKNLKQVSGWNIPDDIDIETIFSTYAEFKFFASLRLRLAFILSRDKKKYEVLKGDIKNLNLVNSKKYLESLPFNSVGYSYNKFMLNKDKLFITSYIQESKDLARHRDLNNFLGLTHEFFHLIYGYDESLLGEALLQVCQSRFLFNPGAKLIAIVLLIKEARKNKNYKEIFQLYREAVYISKRTKWNLILYYSGDFLTEDIDLVRERFSASPAAKFLSYTYSGDDYVPSTI